MKKLSLILTGILMAALVFTGCKKDNFESSELPANFKVDIPNSISSFDNTKSVKVDAVGGDEIYQHMRMFIAVGESSADIVQSIIYAIKQYNLDEAQTFSYTSDDDGRIKNVTIEENVEFDGTTWQYGLTMTDAESEGGDKDGKGLQIFWNNNPVKGVAILYPYNINRKDSTEAWNKGMFRIDYSEAQEYGYEKSMIVSISDIPVSADDVYGLDGMKMFVGKNGDVVDVYGNSAHPNAYFFNSDKGFDWAFVASGNQTSDLGVAEVGLPPYNLDENSRTVLLKDYSIYNVFTDLITEWYYDSTGTTIDSLTLAAYLQNTKAPGFFNKNGFLQAETAPSADFNALVTNIEALSPYNPKYIADLKVEFK